MAKTCRNAPAHSIYLTVLDCLEDRLAGADVRAMDIAARVAAYRELLAAIVAGPDARLDRAVQRYAALPIPCGASAA